MSKAITFLIATLMSAMVCAQASHDSMAKPAGFDPKRDAAKDIANAVKLAQKQNKRVLIDVGGEW